MNIYELQRIVGQRLHQRQLQAARYGYNADPVVANESQDLSDLKRWIDRTIQIHTERGYTTQLEQTVKRKAQSLGIYIDILEYE